MADSNIAEPVGDELHEGPEFHSAAAPVQLEPSEEDRHHHRRHRIRRERRGPSLLVIGLVVALGIETVALVIAFAHAFVAETSLVERHAAGESRMHEIAFLRAENRELKDRLGGLVKERIPDLRPIRMEQVIPINEGPVKDIHFLVSGTDEEKFLEYKTMLRNAGSGTLQVRLNLQLFNRVGIQIGESAIGGRQDAAGVPAELNGGELASFSGQVPVGTESDPPAYFRIVGGG
jgi:hypothetical protein